MTFFYTSKKVVISLDKHDCCSPNYSTYYLTPGLSRDIFQQDHAAPLHPL